MSDSPSEPTSIHGDGIAIVGIACALPSGPYSDKDLDYHALWDFLLQKEDAYEAIPGDRFNIEAWHGTNVGQIKTTRGTFLKDSTVFDHLEFGIPYKDATAMSPSTRKLIELSFLALLDSGIDYRGKDVGCFMSGTNPGLLYQDEYDLHGSFAGLPTMVANRVSYALDIRGPSVSLDTACSSSLTATHLAMQSLLNGDCEAVLAGGCQYNHSIVDWINYTQGGILSPEGVSKPFDASANGFSRGEGAAVLVLKRAADALRDGDHIYAKILGSSINSSGGGSAPNVPVGKAQQACVRQAFKRANRSVCDVHYVELHATGTSVGDPIEANAAGEVFRSDHELIIGSIKGNVGHLEITAFLASLLKVCLIFEKRVIPPQAKFLNPNPNILWHEFRLHVPTVPFALPLRRPTDLPLISISSFGIGGSNGHMVLEGLSSSENVYASTESSGPCLLLAGGLTPRSAIAIASSVLDKVTTNPDHASAWSSSLARRARQMAWRSFALYEPGQPTFEFSEPVLVPRSKPSCVFVISGQGPQHQNMGRQFYRLNDAFRHAVHDMDLVYARTVGHSFLATTGLFAPPVSTAPRLPEIWPITITLPALAMFHCALIDMMQSVGVVPDVVLGHSAGETSVLYASGAASKEMVMELAIARGRAMSTIEGDNGTMAALACSHTTAKTLLAEIGGSSGPIDIACYNAPNAIAISGARTAVERVLALADRDGIWARKLRTNIPVHSSMMERCREAYESAVADVFDRHGDHHAPKIATYSTSTGQEHTERFSADYFWHNARDPVLFTKAVSTVQAENPGAVFVEISPHPVLLQYITEISADCTALSASRRHAKDDMAEYREFLDCLGRLSVLGHNGIDLRSLNGNAGHHHDALTLPYPFAKRHVPFHSESPEYFSLLQHQRGPLNRKNLRINYQTHPELAQHIIHGEAIMPAAGFLEMALEFGARQLIDVTFDIALSLSSERPAYVSVQLERSKWTVKSTVVAHSPHSAQTTVEDTCRTHAEGMLSFEPAGGAPVDVSALRKRCVAVDMHRFQTGLNSFSNFGPAFRRIQRLFQGKKELLAYIRGPDDKDSVSRGYCFYPAVLDASFQAAFHFLTPHQTGDVYYLPSKVGSMFISDSCTKDGLPPVLVAHVAFLAWSPSSAIFNITLARPDGSLLCKIESFEMASHRADVHQEVARRFDWIWQPLNTPSNHHQARDSTIESPTSSPDGDSPYVIHYLLGQESQVQSAVLELSKQESVVLWLCATAQPEGQGVLGLSRSLAREYPSWDVHCALFADNIPWEDRVNIIYAQQAVIRNEFEVYFDSDQLPKIGRVVSASSPSRTCSFDPEEPWQRRNHTMIQLALLPLAEDHVSIRITNWSTLPGSTCGFVGQVLQTGEGPFLVKDTVLGLAARVERNTLTVRADSLVRLSDLSYSASDFQLLSNLALPLCVAYLATLPWKRRLHRPSERSVLIAEQCRVELKLLGEVLAELGWSVATEESLVLDSPASSRARVDLVITSGSAARRFNKQRARHTYLWDDPEHGVEATLAKAPWLLGEGLEFTLGNIDLRKLAQATHNQFPIPDALSLPAKGSRVVYEGPLFYHQKSYLLVGGLGGLGVRIALWMYENGARNLILTSRSGIASIKRASEPAVSDMLEYLIGRDDLHLQLEACDATSQHAVDALIKGIDPPLGGCMLLPLVLIDGVFLNQTEETFAKVHASKSGAFEVLSRALRIDELDFSITFSSAVGLFGNGGQSNYASACTTMDAMTAPFAKAFTLIVPGIKDVGSLARKLNHHDRASANLAGWAITSEVLCDCIRDGILKLSDGPFTHYIPDLNWAEVAKAMGVSKSFEHLVELQPADMTGGSLPEAASLFGVVRTFLQVPEQDFSNDVPLTRYGLDSLGAVRLSFALRPFGTVSQLQLLGDLSTNDLDRLFASQEQALTTSHDEPPAPTESVFDETIVKLRDDGGIPLIIIHGGGGWIRPFDLLKANFSSSLWAIQMTADTPMESVEAMTEFYFQRVKTERAEGPYRLAAYSASSIIGISLAKRFEAAGDRVVQLAFLDHFPLVLFELSDTVDGAGVLDADGHFGAEQARKSLETMRVLFAADKTLPGREMMYKGLGDALRGEDIPAFVKAYRDKLLDFMALVFRCAVEHSAEAQQGDKTVSGKQAFIAWLSGVRAPPSLYLAREGMRRTLSPESMDEFAELGIRACYPEAKVYEFEGGHYDILADEKVAHLLQIEWLEVDVE